MPRPNSTTRCHTWSLVATTVVALIAASAASAAGWVGPTPLTGSGPDVLYEQVIVEADGDAYAAWTEVDATFTRVFVARRPVASGAWQVPEPVSPAGENAIAPRIAVDGAGNATAVWQRFIAVPESRTVFASERSAATGTWSAPAALGSPGAEPAVSVNAAGMAVAVWRELGAVDERAMASVRSAPGAAWSTAEPLSGAGDDASPVAAKIDVAGNAVAVWIARPTPRVQASSRPASTGVWDTTPTLLSGTLDAQLDLALGMDAAGNATAIFSAFDNVAMQTSVQSATKAAGGAWGSHTSIIESNDITTARPALAVHPSGRMVALWSEVSMAGRTLRSASRTAAANPWGSPVDLRDLGDTPSCCGVAIGSTGDVTVITALAGVIEAQQRVGDNGSWGPAVTLGTDFFNTAPTAGGDDAGHVIGLWTRNGGQSTSDLVTATFDVSAPIIDMVTVPGTVTAGQAAAMSAGVRDLWSPVAEVRWTFGDGSAQVVGGLPSHTYANPGSYTVTLRATDAAGNATETARSITVVAPPPAPPLVTLAAKVTGTPIIGTRLTCPATVSNTTSSSVEWRRGTRIVARTLTYRIAAADLGKRLQCAVTASGPGGTATSTSAPRMIPARCIVPATRGLKVTDARTRLANRGCRSRIVRVKGTGVARGRVLGTAPTRGSSVLNGVTITVRVRR